MAKQPTCCGGVEPFLDTRLFKALSDPTRAGLLVYLADRCEPLTVSEAGQCCDIDLSVVSRHLAILRDAGIVGATKVGREVRYAVRFPELAKALRNLAAALDACCPPKPRPTKESPQ